MNISSPIFRRRKEWDSNVKMYPDSCGMVGRPITHLEFSYLVRDIKEKLHIDSAKRCERLLDVGCGNGFLLSKIKDNMLPFGIDFSSAMIKKSQEIIPNSKLFMGEAIALPFCSNIFDRVLCYSIFHYFPDEQYAAETVKEMIRICKKGGYILIGDIPSLKHKNKLTKRELNSYSKKDRPEIHKLDGWLFYDLERLSETIEKMKCSAQILSQPENLIASHYRFDIVAKKL